MELTCGGPASLEWPPHVVDGIWVDGGCDGNEDAPSELLRELSTCEVLPSTDCIRDRSIACASAYGCTVLASGRVARVLLLSSAKRAW